MLGLIEIIGQEEMHIVRKETTKRRCYTDQHLDYSRIHRVQPTLKDIVEYRRLGEDTKIHDGSRQQVYHA